MVLWVESWVQCTKALTQWDVLSEYARATDNIPLAMDCLWRLHEWTPLQQMLVQNQGQVGICTGCLWIWPLCLQHHRCGWQHLCRLPAPSYYTLQCLAMCQAVSWSRALPCLTLPCMQHCS